MTHAAHAHWALQLIIEIDRFTPFCGAFLRSSAERRQVIAAYLCAQSPVEEAMGRIGDFLRSADHFAILNAAYRNVPHGLRGALGRAGPTVHDQQFYSTLHQMLSVPALNQIKNCIARLPSFDFMMLETLNILPEPICRANVVEAIKSVTNAQDISASFHLLVGRGVDQEATATAVRNCAVALLRYQWRVDMASNELIARRWRRYGSQTRQV